MNLVLVLLLRLLCQVLLERGVCTQGGRGAQMVPEQGHKKSVRTCSLASLHLLRSRTPFCVLVLDGEACSCGGSVSYICRWFLRAQSPPVQGSCEML